MFEAAADNAAAARAQREADNRQQLDLLMAAYNRYLERQETNTVTGPMPKTEVGKQLFDSFFNTVGFTTSERTRGANEFLLNARNPEEFLTMAGITKPAGWQPTSMAFIRNPRTNMRERVWQPTPGDYSNKLNAATQLFNNAQATALTGGSSFFNFSKSATEEELKKRYDLNRFLPSLTKEIQDKYNALGGYQRGLLANETATVEDDEKILFKTNPALAVEAEIASLKTNFNNIIKEVNTEFTNYLQSKNKLGKYQTSALSEDQMLQALGQRIRSSYTTFGGESEDSFIGNQYMSPTIKDVSLNNFNIQDYMGGLPKRTMV